MTNLYRIKLTEDEMDAIITQLGARLDELSMTQTREAKNGNVSRVLELEEFMKPIVSGKQKLEKERYSL